MLDKLEKELNTEFIPDLYDKAMDGAFDEKYYEAGEEDLEEEDHGEDLNLLKDNFDNVGKLDGE